MEVLACFRPVFFNSCQMHKKISRTWLAYSKSCNAIYCVPCRIFSDFISKINKNTSSWATTGFVNWKRRERIGDHEKKCIIRKILVLGELLKFLLEKLEQIKSNRMHFRRKLITGTAITDVMIYLAKQGLPFRGSEESENMGSPKSGKFLNTIGLVSHYNQALRDHIKRHIKGRLTYFSHGIYLSRLGRQTNCVRQF